MSVRYTRQFKLNDQGSDVEGVGRALARSHTPGNTGWLAFIALPKSVRRRWGARKQDDLRRFKKRHGLKIDALYTKTAHVKLEPYFDAKARSLMAEWHPPVKLIEPRQGWRSLARSLWEGFSHGRGMGLTDEGTYNPNSRLPSGAPSDHAVYPAFAYDLGVPTGKESVGWAYFEWARKQKFCNYVIYRDKIWSVSSGLHGYTYGGHESHVHTSGKRTLIARVRALMGR